MSSQHHNHRTIQTHNRQVQDRVCINPCFTSLHHRPCLDSVDCLFLEVSVDVDGCGGDSGGVVVAVGCSGGCCGLWSSLMLPLTSCPSSCVVFAACTLLPRTLHVSTDTESPDRDILDAFLISFTKLHHFHTHTTVPAQELF